MKYTKAMVLLAALIAVPAIAATSKPTATADAQVNLSDTVTLKTWKPGQCKIVQCDPKDPPRM